jgi:hypothetical protein
MADRAARISHFKCQTAYRGTSICYLAACFARVMHRLCLSGRERAQGRPDAGRTRSLVCSVESTRVRNYRLDRSDRPSLRNGLRLIRALLGDRALIASVALRKRPAGLDPSIGRSGPHDFAVRTGITRQLMPARPSHPTPNARDDRDAPLAGGNGATIPRSLLLIKRNIFRCRT